MRMKEKVKIFKRPRLRNPYFICAWPGMGEVAYGTVQYLIEKLKAEEFASFQAEDIFYPVGVVIKDSIVEIPASPFNKFYFWKNKGGSSDLILFLSNSQPDLSKSSEYCQLILKVLEEFDVKRILCFAAMPLPIDHTQTPEVWATATSKELLERLKEYDLKIMPEGQVSGMNGLFLGIAKKEKNMDGVCLLGEMPIYTIQIENPRSSLSVLKVLTKMLKIELDTKPLEEQAVYIEEQIEKLLDYLKLSGEAKPIGEEEIEKLKKALSQYTKLPSSVKEKIEKLFLETKKDISKAQDLKKELDKWNIYKEYEDRFLDLFKKPKKDEERG